MPATVAEKLKIKAGYTLYSLHAPANFKQELGPLPSGTSIAELPGIVKGDYQQIHWFVLNKAVLEKELRKIMALLKPEVMIWIYYPKGSSKIQTDLTRDKGWESLLEKGDQLTWVSLISFNDSWSVFGVRARTASDEKKIASPKVREIFNWIDPVKKEVRLPADFEGVLKKQKEAWTFFNTLSFSNRKEYIEWIVTAKKEETRQERIRASVQKLGKHWKNPTTN